MQGELRLDFELMRTPLRGMIARSLIAMVLTVVATSTSASDVKPEQFAAFLARFVSDESFRLSRVRLPLPAAIGNEESDEVRKYRWSKAEVRENLQEPHSKDELTKEGLDQEITWLSSTHVKLFQFRPDADSYLIECHFRRVHGQWYLTSYRDFSM